MMQPDPSGVVIVDKPDGATSAKVLARVKSLYRAKKAGHAGTLDPFATGVLVCCLNQATRLARFFLHGRKKYWGTLHLGIDTDTQDLTGRVLAEKSTAGIKTEDVQTAMALFQGTIAQVPPVYSALKHKGTPLYRLARSGNPVQKPPRQVTIDRLTILEVAIPQVHFEVTCSAGTYIRTLCADVGRRLGCGGHLQALQRLESSGFTLDEAVSLDDLEQLAADGNPASRLIPMADTLRGMPEVTADRHMADRIVQGQQVMRSDLIEKLDLAPETAFKVLDNAGRLLAVMSLPKDGQRLNYSCVFNR